MKYSVAFKGLPFEPEKRQVIFVENLHDERINMIIKGNYDQIKWIFGRASLDFIYLPMFFNDEETREKVLYYAPYLTSEIIEKAELRSSYLLGYMSHQENKEKIVPSLLYSPKKDDEEWIFQGQTIDIDGDELSLVIQWFEDAAAEIEEKLSEEESHRVRLHVRLDEEDDGVLYRSDEDWDEEESKVEYSSIPDLGAKAKRWAKSSKESEFEEGDVESDKKYAPSTLDEIREEGIDEAMVDFKNNAKTLRMGGVSLAALIEILIKDEPISRLRITDDLRIILPDYNNIEVKMTAQHKAVYLLFLYYTDGIVLQRLEEHHKQLLNYYRQTSKKELTPKMIDGIKKLEAYGNAINPVLSRIKEAFEDAFDEHLAKNYIIVGRPGEPYRIPLNPDLIIWGDEDE